MVHRIPDEAARLTAIRIFMAVMIGIGAMLALAIGIEEPGQILLILGIVWGAIFISLRDLIQNFVSSLTLLMTGEYRIGDRIRIRNIFGFVMDISILRTTLMELDRESGDSPTGEIVTIPNGILFREVVINTTRHLSIVTDEIRSPCRFPPTSRRPGSC